MPDILYHYCSSEAFHSIIKLKSIRLSSVLLSNDYREGEVFGCLFNEFVMRASFSEAEKERIYSCYENEKNGTDFMAFCLSEKKDMLSQWRGYADNAYGFSLGFNKKELEKKLGLFGEGEIAVVLRKVLYSCKEHDRIVKEIVNKLRRDIKFGSCIKNSGEGAVDLSGLMIWANTIASLHRAYLIKSKAFEEEVEWRIISSRKCCFDDDMLKYSVHKDKIVPYYELPIKDSVRCLSSVCIGPKNMTPVNVIRQYLQQSGFGHVDVKKSEASYR